MVALETGRAYVRARSRRRSAAIAQMGYRAVIVSAASDDLWTLRRRCSARGGTCRCTYSTGRVLIGGTAV
jgi:hypothetical protein